MNLKKMKIVGVLFILVYLTACNNGNHPPRKAAPNTASISFTMHLAGESTAPETARSAPLAISSPRKGALDCLASGIDTVEATLYNSQSEVIGSGGWMCEYHSGDIKDVPAPQSDVTILLVAKDKNGNVVYRGEKGELQINPGKNAVKTIAIYPFIPAKSTPAAEPNRIQWDPVVGAESYHVVISENEDLSNPAIKTDCDTADFIAKDLEPDVPHYVRVFAQDKYGHQSAGSPTGVFTPVALAPPPTNVTATGGPLKINLGWDGKAGTRYNIYWSTTPGVTKENKEGVFENIDGSTFVHDGCQGNTTYYYGISAHNSVDQEGYLSTEVSATAVGNPYAPDSITAVSGDRTVTLNWTYVPGFRYYVYWSTEPGITLSNYQEQIDNADSGSFTHQDCDGVQHYYIVTAYNDLGESEPSEVIMAAPGWIKLLGTQGDQTGQTNAVDTAGNVYVVGLTDEDFEVHSNIGGQDILFTKYDTRGRRQWVKLFGTADWDLPWSIGADTSGNTYLTGLTDGNWRDQTSAGRSDFLLNVTPNGNEERVAFLNNVPPDEATDRSIVVDSDGNRYITGHIKRTSGDSETYDVFTARYDANGNQTWIDYLSTTEDEKSHGITLDGEGHIYITGETDGLFPDSVDANDDPGFRDAFVAKYAASDGRRVWVTRIPGFRAGAGWRIAANQSYCYVSGESTFNRMLFQFYADKGTYRWGIYMEPGVTYDTDAYFQIAIAPSGNLIAGGATKLASYEGQDNAGEADADGKYTADGSMDTLLLAYDHNGNLLWSTLYGTPQNDVVKAMTIDGDGYAYITGHTGGNFGGHQKSGLLDIFTWKHYVGP